ncbi:hypothetical protein RFI_08532, partial [Reticulomyxa filosa]
CVYIYLNLRTFFIFFFFLKKKKGDKFGQMPLQIEQWVQYHRMQGFDHFYIYDHQRRLEGNTIYEALQPYINRGLVTYILYPVDKTTRRWPVSNLYYQHAQIHSCMTRFRFESDFIANIDVDEWIIPNVNIQFNDKLVSHIVYTSEPDKFQYGDEIDSQTVLYICLFREEQKRVLVKDSKVVDMIDYMYNTFGVNYIEINRYIGSTCYEQLGCDVNKNNFTTFIERGRCLVFVNGLPKWVMDPLASKLAWTHYVEIVDNWLPFKPADSNMYYTRKNMKGNLWWLLLSEGVARRRYEPEKHSQAYLQKDRRMSTLTGPLTAIHLSNHWQAELYWQRKYSTEYLQSVNASLIEVYRYHGVRHTIIDDVVDQFHLWLQQHRPYLLHHKQVHPLIDTDASFCWDTTRRN